METVSYARKRQLWIGGKNVSGFVDLRLLELSLQIYIEDNSVTIKNPEAVVLMWNEIETEKEMFDIAEGDTLELPGMLLTFFRDRLEICAESSAYQTTLLPVRGEEGEFEGFPFYKRSPRVIYRVKKENIEIKAPPQKKEMSKSSIAQLIIPSICMLAFTIAMGIFMKRGPYVYMTAGMTVITMVFSVQKFFSERKEMKADNKKRIEIYDNYLLGIRKKVRRLREEERQALNYQNPTITELSDMINGYSSRIYERNALEDDFMNVNLGYYQGGSSVTVEFKEKELDVNKDELIDDAQEIVKEYGKIEHIPVEIDLKRAHLGLVGSKANVHEQLKYIMAQLTFFHSYHDLQIIFIHNGDYDDSFHYTRWYPHLRIQAINVVSEISSEQARDQILGSIQQLLKERKLKLDEEKQETIFTPHLLFIIDEPKLILNHAIMEYLQGKEMNLGFSIIYTTDQKANLPENMQTVCLLQNAEEGVLLLDQGERRNRSFEIEHIETVNLEKMARSLNALIHEQGVSSKIPESITFFDMYQVEHPQELNISQRWKKNESHKSLAVPLGVRAEEDYVDLNLHEKAHGPHGLVAGTTGSGKSEIVQSYILSLAVNFHPHEVGFLLIDYKGGGMANLFAKLPHLLGTITNLDKAESMRAMASIKSELSRRQRIFGEHNVNHINGYNKLFKLGKVEEPLPHLFLISDEFAELKKEQPEFMSELVSAARIGRSLGIHLILATQKPSGVVDDQIWTNSKFKLCLKVQNAGDSKEMLHTPDAANITQAGRAYLQVGNNEIYELFQSAWSGATYDAELAEEEKEDDRVYVLNSLGQGELINQDLSTGKEGNQIKATQLDVVVEHIKEIYDAQQPVEVKKPWLPSLPHRLVSPYTQNVADSASFTELDLTLGLGLVDIPEEQKQEEYMLDFIKNGHLLYMASSGYGKTMLLMHIALGLAMKNAVSNLNLYVIDLGNSAMIPLKGLPHTADYIGIDDEEKQQKFQKFIIDEISKRKKAFAKAMTQNFDIYNQSQKEPLKAIIILLDNYDVLGELGDQMLTFIQRAARDGASLGIYLVTTLTRDNVMRSATKSSFKERIAGFNFVEGENSGFIGRSIYSIPEEIKGRALVKTDSIHMMQLYTPVEFSSMLEFNNRLQECIKTIEEANSGERAIGVPLLPEVFTSDMVDEYREKGKQKLIIGLDQETVSALCLEKTESPFLIIGPSGSGKTNVLHVLIKQMAEEGTVYLFESQKKDLSRWKNEKGVVYLEDSMDFEDGLEELEDLLPTAGGLKTLHFIVIHELADVIENEQQAEQYLDICKRAAQNQVLIVIGADSGKLKGRDSMTKYVKESKYGLVLGNQGLTSVFPVTRTKELPTRTEDGLLFKQGAYRNIRLPKYKEE